MSRPETEKHDKFVEQCAVRFDVKKDLIPEGKHFMILLLFSIQNIFPCSIVVVYCILILLNKDRLYSIYNYLRHFSNNSHSLSQAPSKNCARTIAILRIVTKEIVSTDLIRILLESRGKVGQLRSGVPTCTSGSPECMGKIV